MYTDSPSESRVVPVCLPWQETDPGAKLFVGYQTVAAGWGRTTNDKSFIRKNLQQIKASTDILMKAIVPAVAKSKCDALDEFKTLNTTVHICAGGEPGVDSCNGDSGGPLLYQSIAKTPWFQVGVTSFGTSKCGIGKPGVYNRLSAFLPWIKENLLP